MPTVTGPQLRRTRRDNDVTVVEVASRMGLSRQTVHNLERDCEPDPERVAEYLAALAAALDAKETA